MPYVNTFYTNKVGFGVVYAAALQQLATYQSFMTLSLYDQYHILKCFDQI